MIEILVAHLTVVRVAEVVNAMHLVQDYLLQTDLEAHDNFVSEERAKQIRDLEIFETTELVLDISLIREGAESIVIRDARKSAYWSKDENRLYVSSDTSAFSGDAAKELSRMFTDLDVDVFPFLNSIVPVASDEKALRAQMRLFGIEHHEEEYTGPQKVELIQLDDEVVMVEELEKPPSKGRKVAPSKVEPPQHAPRSGLIEPDDYFPARRREYVAYARTEGGDVPRKPKTVQLKKGMPGTTNPPSTPRLRIGTKDAEGIALQMVINYEESQKRSGEDRHRQKGIGYDIYSSGADGEEIFIEVKHFSERPGRFRLTPHQLEKAKIEGDKYYVYIVVGLREDSQNTKIYIVQNPVRFLRPDPPIEHEYSDWQSGVREEVIFERA